MIAIKATRAPKDDDPGPSRKRYLPKAVASSRLPLYIALALAAAVAYLESLFPSLAGKAPAPPAEEEPKAAAPGASSLTAEAAPEPGQSEEEGEAAAPNFVEGEVLEEPVGSSALIRREPKAFVLLDSPSINFAVPEVAVRTATGQFEFRPRIGNDNQPRMGGGIGGGGGGNGGNGGGHGVRPESPQGPDSSGEDDDDEPENPGNSGGGDGGPALNRAPRARSAYLGDFVTGHAVVITFAMLLQQADDPDGNTLTVSDAEVSSGTLTAIDGGFLYTPAEGELGFGTVTYKIGDGQAAVLNTASFRVVLHHPVTGTDGDDVIAGSPHADAVDAGAGDDNVDAGAGDDVVHAGSGSDIVVAGAGNDSVFGETGNDVVFGSSGNDIIFGGAGDDRLFGEAGDDLLDGGEGNDILSGGSGNDVLRGGPGDDQLAGDTGGDILDGGPGTDLLQGGDEADYLDGGEGSDDVQAGDGDDVITATLDAADDRYDGENGNDTMDISASVLGVIVDLATGKATGVEIGEDVISSIETVLGGQGDDQFIVGTAPVSIVGGMGADDFRFAAIALPSEAAPTVHSIQDFSAGDRIFIESRYQVSKETTQEVADLFQEVYGEQHSSDGRSIRYHNEVHDSMERTRLEADLDGDAVYELAINLDGRHVLFIAENIA